MDMMPYINRAMGLLIYMDEVKAAEHLMRDGVDAGTAFLAVKGASVLLKEY